MPSKIKSFFRRLSKDHGTVPSRPTTSASVFHNAPANYLNPPSRKISITRRHKKKKLTNSNLPASSSSGSEDNLLESSEELDLKSNNNMIEQLGSVDNIDKCLQENLKMEDKISLKCSPASSKHTILVPDKSKQEDNVSRDTIDTVGDACVSATITINSLVPEPSGSVATTSHLNIGSTAVVVTPSSSIKHDKPTELDTTDNGVSKTYNVSQIVNKKSPDSPGTIKSISITRLKNDEVLHPQLKDSMASVRPKSSAGFSSKFTSDESQSTKNRNSDSCSSRTNCNEKAKHSENVTSEADAKIATEKAARLERMVSDLVKNAEAKKQEIASLRMEIKRLKVCP